MTESHLPSIPSGPLAPGRPALSRSRKLLFSAIAISLVLAILEGAGTIVDARYGFRARLVEALDNLERLSQPVAPGRLTWPDDTIRLRVDGPPPSSKETYVVGQRVIPGASDAGYQSFVRPDGLANEPRKRIFVVGESAAFGYPYPMEFWFGNMLQKRVADEYVVLNAGQISWGSPDLVPLVTRIVEHYRPAAIILFVGNNEWQHWSGLDQLTAVNRAGRVLRAAGASRAVAALAWWWLRHAAADRGPVTRDFVPRYQLEGIDYAMAHPAERYGSPAMTTWLDARSMFVDAFRRNLTEMVTMAKVRGVHVVLMPTPINYRLSPAWSHPQPESYHQGSSAAVRELLRRAVSLAGAGSNAEGLAVIDQALRLDSDPPMLHYVRGEVLRAMGRHGEAEASYASARERMVGHLGSPLSFQAVVREVAGATSAELVDVPRLFDEYEHRMGSFYNEHLVADDCHPTPLGHRVIADALTAVFRK